MVETADATECTCTSAAIESSNNDMESTLLGNEGGGRPLHATMQQPPPGTLAQRIKRQFADTLLERMKSRASTDVVSSMVSSDGTPETNKRPSDQMAVFDKTDEIILRSTGLAKKRVRVVQLLIVGLIGLLLGCLGNFFVTTSCHFGSTTIQVGQNGDIFEIHFGLWKYSPVDSALNGYSYCYPYAAAQHRAPVYSRLANLLALLLGIYSEICVWCYLILGRWNLRLWQAAVYTAVLAGIFQLTTLFFFAEKICRVNHCRLGPACIVAVITSIVWVIFAWELHYNTPKDKESITSLEMLDLRRASAEYLTRLHPADTDAGYRPPEFTTLQGTSLD